MSVNVFQRPWPKALIVSLVLTTVSAACGSGGAASRPASEIHASPKDQAKLQRIAAVLRPNGFAVRVAGPSDTVAVRLGAEQGLVGLVVSADADDVREKGVVIWALFARAQDAQRYYQALQEWGSPFASAMNEAYPTSTVGGKSFVIYSSGRGVQAYLPTATVPHASTRDVRPYSLSRRNLWRQAERALILSVGVG